MSTADQVIAYGLAEVGEPYVWGAEGPDSFDCSGLMQFIFAKVGVILPRVAREQQKASQPVSAKDARPGDLVFWGDPATHVGLYVGDGRFLAAPRAGTNVRVSTLYGSPEFRRVPGLGGGVQNVLNPGGVQLVGTAGDIARDLLVGIEGPLIIGLVLVGGVGLVVLGAWQATKGGQGQ